MINIAFSEYFCTIQLERIDKKNALTPEMYLQIVDAFEKAAKSSKIKALILKSKGDYFCSGHDIHDFIDNPQGFNNDHPLLKFLAHLENFSKLLICVVGGHAIGIGTTLLLHADFIIAQRGVSLSTPFIKMGLCAEAGSSQLLERIIGRATAREMLLLGRDIKAEQLKGTLINELTSSVAQSDALLKIVKKQISELPLTGILKNKELMQPKSEPLMMTMEREIQAFAQLLQSSGTQKLIKEILQKNKSKSKKSMPE